MNNQTVKSGLIVYGEIAGSRIDVVRSGLNSYLIVICGGDLVVGYDDWVENDHALALYLQECQWVIEWDKKPED